MYLIIAKSLRDAESYRMMPCSFVGSPRMDVSLTDIIKISRLVNKERIKPLLGKASFISKVNFKNCQVGQ